MPHEANLLKFEVNDKKKWERSEQNKTEWCVCVSVVKTVEINLKIQLGR